MYHYVISDIHGDLEGFHRILEKINFVEDDQLYILGDIIDRGPEPIKLLKEIMVMSNVHVLLGNHEYMMLESLGQNYEAIHGLPEKVLDPQETQKIWLRNGGHTLYQFIAEDAENRKEILEYLLLLPLNIQLTLDGKEFLLCHAAMADEDAYQKYADWEESLAEFAVWNREWAVYDHIDDVIVITGHTPTGNMDDWQCEVYEYPGGILDIDTGAAYPDLGGRISVTRLEDMTTFYDD